MRHTRVPVLLIHGANDTNIPPFHSAEIQAANPGDIVLWKVPGAVHTGAYAAAPGEFERRVVNWMVSHESRQKPVGRPRRQLPSYQVLGAYVPQAVRDLRRNFFHPNPFFH